MYIHEVVILFASHQNMTNDANGNHWLIFFIYFLYRNVVTINYTGGPGTVHSSRAPEFTPSV